MPWQRKDGQWVGQVRWNNMEAKEQNDILVRLFLIALLITVAVAIVRWLGGFDLF